MAILVRLASAGWYVVITALGVVVVVVGGAVKLLHGVFGLFFGSGDQMMMVRGRGPVGGLSAHSPSPQESSPQAP